MANKPLTGVGTTPLITTPFRCVLGYKTPKKYQINLFYYMAAGLTFLQVLVHIGSTVKQPKSISI